MKLFITNLTNRISEWQRSDLYTLSLEKGGISHSKAIDPLRKDVELMGRRNVLASEQHRLRMMNA